MTYLGIDVGTQSLKVMVTDSRLRILAIASESYPTRYPRPGWAEQDPRDWERAASRAVPRALAGAGIDAAAVAAVGIAGQLDGCVAVDASGEPVAPCLIWMDRRAVDFVPELPSDFVERTGLVADPGHMAAKIAWLARGNPGARYHQPVSYLVERMTGEACFDPALASTTMLFELGSSTPSQDLCALFEIDPQTLPRVVPADQQAGQVSAAGAKRFGLVVGTPVATGTGDDFATPLGGGVVGPGPLFCVLGTAEVVGAVFDSPVIDNDGLLETHGYFGDSYLVENPGWLAGGSVSWARELLGFDDDAALDRAAAEVPPGSDGLLFLPALTGAMAPRWNAGARGCFYGLTPAHGRGHLARAVLEGCALAMRDVQERMQEIGRPADSIIALGGGAASKVWLQIRADVGGLEVHGSELTDSCALGAAMLAAAAAQGRPVLELAAEIEHTRQSFEPRPELRATYDVAHRSYRQLFDRLEPLFDG